MGLPTQNEELEYCCEEPMPHKHLGSPPYRSNANLSVEDTKRAWNPRFVAYSVAHGRFPERQLQFDTEKFPGGKMCGFIVWMSERWDTFHQLRGWNRREHVLSQQDHADFDRWLGQPIQDKCTALCCNERRS